jgi:hypothetical protein
MIDLRFQPMTTRVKWKDEWGRYLKRSPFKGRAPMDELERELKLLEATDIVVESGHDRSQIRNDGWPRSATSPAFSDIRLFFKCKHGTLRYECRIFATWEANLRAIGLWLQRQRLAIEEWGIGTGGEAYRGFAALPAGASSILAEEFANVEAAARFILGVEGFTNPSRDEVEAVCIDPDGSWKAAAKKAHPDAGGSNELMAKVNRARDFIEREGTT